MSHSKCPIQNNSIEIRNVSLKMDHSKCLIENVPPIMSHFSCPTNILLENAKTEKFKFLVDFQTT